MCVCGGVGGGGLQVIQEHGRIWSGGEAQPDPASVQQVLPLTSQTPW